jgi:hypothetical protein
MDKKVIIWAIAIGGVGYGAYWYLTNTVKAYASAIVKGGASSGYETLLTFDKPYLKAWATAVKAKQDTFTYNGLIFNTQGGSTKK